MARILKVIVDYDVLFQRTRNPTIVFQNMLVHEAEYDPHILSAFRLMVLRNFSQSSYKVSIHTLLSQESENDFNIWSEFRQIVPETEAQPSYQVSAALKGEKEIIVDGIRSGMVLSRDVSDKNGTLIVSKSTVVTDVLMYKLINYFHSQEISEPVYIESAI